MTTALVHFNHILQDGVVTWPKRTIEWEPNYGDMLVCAAILREIDIGDHFRVNLGDSPGLPAKKAILRGSTYLHNSFNFARANATIDELDCPVVTIGLGAQNQTADVSILDGNRDAHDFVARLRERSHSISARGRYSAAVLERLGAKDVRITGCPSLFYRLTAPQVSMPPLLATAERRLGVSTHLGLHDDMFCRSAARTKVLHRAALIYAIRNSSIGVFFEQGVGNEANIADESLPVEERRAYAAAFIRETGSEGLLTENDLLARMVSVTSIDDWLATTGRLDAMIGFRFHGNMVALLQARPCFFYVYDSRIEEFCELYALPFQDADAPWRDPVRAMLDHDWEQTNASIRSCYTEMKAFLEENGLTHRLP